MTFWNQVYTRLLRITSSGRYIPEIDGFRFIAISGVVFFHCHYVLSDFGFSLTDRPIDRAAAYLFEMGFYGVQLFFIISGFILALPFIQHYTQGAKPVRIGPYYLRRLTRLEPPYLICLTLFFIAAVVLNDDIGEGTYLSQYLVRFFYGYGLLHNDASLLNGVTWSLEIEIQFYLLVPLLVRLFKLPPKVRRPLLLVLIFALAWRPLHGTRLQYTVLNYLQYFLAGFLLADIYLHHIKDLRKKCGKHDLAGIAIAVAGAFLAQNKDWFQFLLPVMGIGFYYTAFHGRLLNRIFTTRFICIVGGMCYTIYLYHYPFMRVMSQQLWKLPLGDDYLVRYAVHSALMLPVLAVIWLIMYGLIERPCMDRMWPARLWKRLRGSG